MERNSTYRSQRARLCQDYHSQATDQARTDAIRQSPLVSLAVKYAVDFPVAESSDCESISSNTPNDESTHHSSNDTSEDSTTAPASPGTARPFQFSKDDEAMKLVLPQCSLIGFDLDNSSDDDHSTEPILFNTNAPSSVFLCGSQGSGKSYTLSCILENHLLEDQSFGVQHETIPGFVFHWDTNTSGYQAEAASLCSRGIKVRLLVSWSNYQQMKTLYEDFARTAGGNIEVRPLLFDDKELTVGHIRNLMAFGDGSQGAPLYLEVIQDILRRCGRNNQAFSVKQFLEDVKEAGFIGTQMAVLEQRLTLLKYFSAATAPEIVQADHPKLKQKALDAQRQKQGLDFTGDCIVVEKGTLTIIDLSDPFVDANTACTLFDSCLDIILKRHKEAVAARNISPGLIITLDEAHKFLDKDLPAADVFTSSLLTTIREQRHNAARVVIATQEPSISEKLLDLCSLSIGHRFSSPAWFGAIADHLGGASSMTVTTKGAQTPAAKKAELFNRILALKVGESLVFSPTSWVRGGEVHEGGKAVEPSKLGSEVLWMKTRERKGKDAGRTVNVI